MTGGAGFIGTHLTLRLLKEGHQVTVLDDLSSGEDGRLRSAGAELVNGSVLDESLVLSLSSQCDHIVHLAAVVGVRLAMQRGIETLRVSFVGTDNVLRGARAFCRETFIASSSAVHGKLRKIPVREDDDSLLGGCDRASWLYSAAKLVEDHLAMAYFREHGIPVKLGRFFNVIGPFQKGVYGMVVPRFVQRALRSEPLPVYGTGEQTRTFVHIEDALDGLQLVMNRGESGRAYNIGGTEEISILELAERIIALSGSSSDIRLIPFEEAFGADFEETSRRIPDISRLRDLGYNPGRSLSGALAEIIEHHRHSEGP
ncbi:MAG: NAD-dependent epimerase/dehydratase family protein [Bacillota bacterium]